MIAQLKARDLENLDIENLIEELEGLAGRDRRELKNRLTTLLEHLLERCHVKSEYAYAGWQGTIARTRVEIENILEQSPSLKNYINSPELFDDALKNALRIVRAESGYKSVDFPDTWQFRKDIDSILNINFWELNQ
ncbi:protein of unknown function DUF29 [Synechococcus sp. PCC 7502]|uniref:DUF29 domain-containing protein n=1 Tax=Synechococcus sp. PCC 7502 TaxID=1173263 RepID=UPI00029FF4A7|nr:DUF29 domain-containing protein [Synechococcus sp. PCC 7502]AFY74611.1 protein of unknown function DUF29 [Synechococcus sp. PCC 7502]